MLGPGGHLNLAATVLVTASTVFIVLKAAGDTSINDHTCHDDPSTKLAYSRHELEDLNFFSQELLQMKRLMRLEANMVFADVGAYDGKYVIPLAYEVLPHGKAYATDVVEGGSAHEGSVKWRGSGYGTAVIEARVEEHNVCAWQSCTTYSKYDYRPTLNVSVALATPDDVGLPAGCCDAIMLRTSYHHIQKPFVALRQFERALKPGGRLLIIENHPQGGQDAEGVPENRAGMGIDGRIVLDEVKVALGWEPVPQDVLDEISATMGWEPVRMDEWPMTRFGAQYAFLFMKPM